MGTLGDRLSREATDLGIAPSRSEREVKVPAALQLNLPVLLAGPVIRRTTAEGVWLWMAWSRRPTPSSAKLIAVDFKKKPAGRDAIPTRFADSKVFQAGRSLYIQLLCIAPATGSLPKDTFIEYDLSVTIEEKGANRVVSLSKLAPGLAYPNFQLPCFTIGQLNRSIAQGSCRRPGAKAADASLYFDRWLSERSHRLLERPASLILSGDQIYADDVDASLFDAIRRLAPAMMGYDEYLPLASGSGEKLADSFSSGSTSDRKLLTHYKSSPIGFTTDDGERHLLSLGEYCAHYLLVWNPELWRLFYRANPQAVRLSQFAIDIQAFRRLVANTPTYMLCDDHEITDDWNLDKTWEEATRRSPLARRVMSNGLAAYWLFQAWGNDPAQFDNSYAREVEMYCQQLVQNGGRSTPAGKSQPVTVEAFERRMLGTYWAFVAATNPPALCVDTRTLRDQGAPHDAAVLIGQRALPALSRLLQAAAPQKGKPLLIVLPSPFLPHFSMLKGQRHEYGDSQKKLHANRYAAEYELFSNNPAQRAAFVRFLKDQVNPSATIIFSGDVHHGFVTSGRYAIAENQRKLESGGATWAMGVVQITSSPIKNEKDSVFRDPVVFDWSVGDIGEMFLEQFEHKFAELPGKAGVIGMQAAVRTLSKPLGEDTYVYEPHYCVVRLPTSTADAVEVLFVGEKGGKVATSSVSVRTDNDPTRFKVQRMRVGGKNLPGRPVFN